MSITVTMPDDIRGHNTKILGPFTFRDLVCGAISLVFAIPVTIIVPTTWDNKALIFILCCIPGVLSARVKIKGLPFEVFMLKYIYLNFLTPKKRKYKTQNKYRMWVEMDKRKRIAKMSKRDRKRYEKRILTLSGKHPIYK